MVLVVIRRENNSNGRPVTVSDDTWKKWTGLEPRTKEAAVAGLRRKCLVIKGRGDTAQYSFARDQWDGFVRTVNRGQYKPRTAGRGVDPKPGAKIHPTCRARGCDLLTGHPNTGPEIVSPDAAMPNAQRVAQESENQQVASGADSVIKISGAAYCENSLIPFPSAPVAQRVARTVTDGAEQLWERTLAALQAIFPLVGVAFLVRLVAVVRAVFADVRDAELAEAVDVAFRLKSKTQRSEGLFLLTVPRAIGAMRSGHPAIGAMRHTRGGPSQAVDVGQRLLEGVRMLQKRVAEALRARGAPFSGHLAALDKLHETMIEGVDLESVERLMGQLEGAIIATGREAVSENERLLCRQCAEEGARPYSKLWGKVQLDDLRTKLEDREILSLLGIPRLSLFYA